MGSQTYVYLYRIYRKISFLISFIAPCDSQHCYSWMNLIFTTSSKNYLFYFLFTLSHSFHLGFTTTNLLTHSHEASPFFFLIMPSLLLTSLIALALIFLLFQPALLVAYFIYGFCSPSTFFELWSLIIKFAWITLYTFGWGIPETFSESLLLPHFCSLSFFKVTKLQFLLSICFYLFSWKVKSLVFRVWLVFQVDI